MKIFKRGLIGFCLVGLFACGGSQKGNQTNLPVSNVSARVADPISFVEGWSLNNLAPALSVERILFDGDLYEAVVSVDEKTSFAILFKKENSKWNVLSHKKVASDYGWPVR